MGKVKDFTKLVISGDDVLLKSICIKPGVVAKLKASGIIIPEEVENRKETENEEDGEWTTPEIIKKGSRVEDWNVGLFVLKTKQEFPMSFLSPDGNDVEIGTVRYSTFPARIIDVAVEKDNYEL